MAQRPRGRAVGLHQPFPKGSLEAQFMNVINSQGLPDSILGPMCEISRSTINHYRTGKRLPSHLPTFRKIIERCGYRLALVRVTDE